MSLLATIAGQDVALEILRHALRNDRVHHAYLFDGPPGVGKELAAYGLAQALVCEAPRADKEACGVCSACVRAVPVGSERPKHPDVHLVGRGVYDPAQIGRRTAETQEISIDQVRTIVLARAAFPPHEGRARIYVVRDADELSTSAANALLKVLEEPGPRTHFVLVTSRPDSLLSTIRSRTQRVRFGALPNGVIAAILEKNGIAKTEAAAAAELGDGSARQALAFADEEATRIREDFVARAVSALAATTLSEALALADDAKKAKDDLPAALEALGAHFAAAARRDPTAADATKNAERFAEVQRVLRELDRNASTQLAMESFFIRARAL